MLIGVGLAFPFMHDARANAQSPVGARDAAGTGRVWLQWGGPERNFVSDSKGLASSWPAGGPKKLWSRALGEGHSSIVVENDRAYTLYRQMSRAADRTTHEEVVAAFDAASGQTIWEFKIARLPVP
jgi:hypothetical protein